MVVRDRVAGTTTLVSRATGAAGAPGDYHSYCPQLSADGSRVAFAVLGRQPRLDPPPDPETPLHRLDVYVRDLAAGTTMLASRANGAAGAPGNADSGGQPGLAISDDGTKVVFHSQATNLGAATRGSVAIQSFLRNLATNTTQAVAGGAASSQWPVISGDGTHVAFLTATGLVSGDTDGQLDVYSHRYVPRTRRRSDADARRPRRPRPRPTRARRCPLRRRGPRSRCAARPPSRAAPPTTSTSPAPRSTST